MGTSLEDGLTGPWGPLAHTPASYWTSIIPVHFSLTHRLHLPFPTGCPRCFKKHTPVPLSSRIPGPHPLLKKGTVTAFGFLPGNGMHSDVCKKAKR